MSLSPYVYPYVLSSRRQVPKNESEWGFNIMSYVYHKVQSSGPKIKVHKGCIVICSIDSKFCSVRYSFFFRFFFFFCYSIVDSKL